MSNHHNTAVATARVSTTVRKGLISLGVVGAAAAVAGLGTFGTFSSTTSGSDSVAAGTVAIALGGTGSNNLTVPAVAAIPGDTIARTVTLTNAGTVDLAGVTLTSVASTSSSLDTDTTNGLQMKIDSCTVAWTQATTTSAASCSGTTVNIVASRAVVGANTAVATTRALPAGGTDNLLVTLNLPTSADNTFQGKTSGFTFTFTGTQRVAGNR